MTVEYSFFIDSQSSTIGVLVDDENSMSISEYNALTDKAKPALMELLHLLLSSYPETIDKFRERLVLIDDPEWNIREQLIFIRGDGGEDIINTSFKSARSGIDIDTALLPGITYRQLFKNSVNYIPTTIKSSEDTIATADKLDNVAEPIEDDFLLTKSPSRFSMRNIIYTMQQHPLIATMLITAFSILSVGFYMFMATPATMILPPDRLQKAALVDQQLNELKVKVDTLWNKVKVHKKLANKTRRAYWQALKQLNLQYQALRRSGFGNGNKFNAVNDIFKQTRDKLRRPKKKKKHKVVKLIKTTTLKQTKASAPKPFKNNTSPVKK